MGEEPRLRPNSTPRPDARTAEEILDRLSEEPYKQRWVAVPVRGSRAEMRRRLRELKRERAVAVDTRVLGARSILVRVGGVHIGGRDRREDAN